MVYNRNEEKIALFKPSDEELFMPNNPKQTHNPTNPKAGDRYSFGIEIGTFWKREIAASYFPYGSAKTIRFETKMPINVHKRETFIQKEGSLQEFCPFVTVTECDLEVCDQMPIESVHQTILFDLLIGNRDRHLGNVMYDQNTNKLVLIDHGSCFPDALVYWDKKPVNKTMCHFASFEQARKVIDPNVKNNFLNLDLETIIDKLREDALLKEESIAELKIRNFMIREALQLNPPLTAKQIFLLLICPEIEDICAKHDGKSLNDFVDNVNKEISILFNDKEFIKGIVLKS